MKRPIPPVKPSYTADATTWKKYESENEQYYKDIHAYCTQERMRRYLSAVKKWQAKTLYAVPGGVMWVETIRGERTVKYGELRCDPGYGVGHDTFAWYKGGMKFWNDPAIAYHGYQRGAFTEEIFLLLKKVYNDDVSDLEIVRFEPPLSATEDGVK